MEPVGSLTVGQSKYLSEMYVYNSVRTPGYVYEFCRLRDRKFVCRGCKKFKKSRCITIENNAVVVGEKHPEDDHHPECRPIPESESLAKQLDRDMRCSVRDTGKRPRDAFSDMMTSIPKKVKTSEKQAEVVEKIPSFNDVRRQLCRHRVHHCTPIPDPLDLPDALRTTMRGKEADADDPNYREPFLLYTGQDGQFN